MYGGFYRLVPRQYGRLSQEESEGGRETGHFADISLSFYCFYRQNAREGDPHTHQISRVSPDHEGLYTCVVGNGESSHMIYTQLGLAPALPNLSHSPQHFLSKIFQFSVKQRPRLIYK